MNSLKPLFSGIDEKDLPVFELLYGLHYSKLCYLCERIVKNKSTTETIVTTVFLNLWKTRMNFNSFDSIKAFLFESLCENTIKQYESNAIVSKHMIINHESILTENTKVLIDFKSTLS